jgi:hypothetical protein
MRLVNLVAIIVIALAVTVTLTTCVAKIASNQSGRREAAKPSELTLTLSRFFSFSADCAASRQLILLSFPLNCGAFPASLPFSIQ